MRRTNGRSLLITLLAATISVASSCERHAASVARRASTARETPSDFLRSENYQAYRQKTMLSSADIRFLLDGLRFDSPIERVHSDGPATQDTIVTEILVSHGTQVQPALIRSLRSANGNVRRYSALCLGRIDGPDTAAVLREAILAETKLAEHSAFQVSGRAGSYYLSPMNSMVAALLAVDGNAPEWLLSLLTPTRQFHNFAVNHALDVQFPASGVLIQCGDACQWTDETRGKWKQHLKLRASLRN